MPRKSCIWLISFLSLFPFHAFNQSKGSGEKLNINKEGYFELPGFDVMLFNDFYPEGHQGGLTIIQFGKRTAANGDVRIDPTPGQWSPVPKVGKREVDKNKGIISAELWYPDSSRNRQGFNPINYPELIFKYTVKAEAAGSSLKINVDLEKSLPDKWADKVGFNLELFPGEYFGEHYLMDGKPGIFPRQPEGPMEYDGDGNLQTRPMAEGKELIVCPGNRKEIKFVSRKSKLKLIDGRGLYNNGWFVLRSTIPAGVSKNAVEWIISPKIDTSWIRELILNPFPKGRGFRKTLPKDQFD
jgi:hypothetical protein